MAEKVLRDEHIEEEEEIISSEDDQEQQQQQQVSAVQEANARTSIT